MATHDDSNRDESNIGDLLTACLSKLRESQQNLLRRFYSGREQGKAIAESLGTTPDALYVKVHRLRRTLLDCVRRGMEEEDAP